MRQREGPGPKASSLCPHPVQLCGGPRVQLSGGRGQNLPEAQVPVVLRSDPPRPAASRAQDARGWEYGARHPPHSVLAAPRCGGSRTLFPRGAVGPHSLGWCQAGVGARGQVREGTKLTQVDSLTLSKPLTRRGVYSPPFVGHSEEIERHGLLSSQLPCFPIKASAHSLRGEPVGC